MPGWASPPWPLARCADGLGRLRGAGGHAWRGRGSPDRGACGRCARRSGPRRDRAGPHARAPDHLRFDGVPARDPGRVHGRTRHPVALGGLSARLSRLHHWEINPGLPTDTTLNYEPPEHRIPHDLTFLRGYPVQAAAGFNAQHFQSRAGRSLPLAGQGLLRIQRPAVALLRPLRAERGRESGVHRDQDE